MAKAKKAKVTLRSLAAQVTELFGTVRILVQEREQRLREVDPAVALARAKAELEVAERRVEAERREEHSRAQRSHRASIQQNKAMRRAMIADIGRYLDACEGHSNPGYVRLLNRALQTFKDQESTYREGIRLFELRRRGYRRF